MGLVTVTKVFFSHGNAIIINGISTFAKLDKKNMLICNEINENKLKISK